MTGNLAGAQAIKDRAIEKLAEQQREAAEAERDLLTAMRLYENLNGRVALERIFREWPEVCPF